MTNIFILSAGIFGLGAIFGGFAAAILGSKFGRRKSLLFLTIPDILGWLLIAASQNLPMILVGRFLQGFASAGYSPSIWVKHTTNFLLITLNIVHFACFICVNRYYFSCRYTWQKSPSLNIVEY